MAELGEFKGGLGHSETRRRAWLAHSFGVEAVSGDEKLELLFVLLIKDERERRFRAGGIFQKAFIIESFKSRKLYLNQLNQLSNEKASKHLSWFETASREKSD